ncbi:MAG: DUF1858 domain-containing protein [Candidatus Kapabacteria bacterium]|jgi:hypothetical protein|nr:DUF1858 domain-containing protein [Candidatus Kapabacteria bacterium]
MIDKNISLEELLDLIPDAGNYLSKKNIKCLACGEPVWGTLNSESKAKGFSDADIDGFVDDLNKPVE